MQAFVLAHLLAGVKEQLHPHADAQNRQAAVDRIEQGAIQLLAAQIVHAVAKGPLAGQHHGPPLGQIRGPIHNVHRDAKGAGHGLKCFVHAAQVAYAVIEDCDHGIWGR